MCNSTKARCVQWVPLGLLWKTQLLAQVSGWESQKEAAQQQRGGSSCFSWDSRSFIWALRASTNLPRVAITQWHFFRVCRPRGVGGDHCCLLVHFELKAVLCRACSWIIFYWSLCLSVLMFAKSSLKYSHHFVALYNLTITTMPGILTLWCFYCSVFGDIVWNM